MSKAKEEPILDEATQPEEGRTELSEAELKEQKAILIKFYKAELPLLRLQAEYEECITRIDIAKMQRFEIMMAKAQAMAPPPGADDGPQQDHPGNMQQEEVQEHVRPENKDKKPRTLKTS